MRDVVFCAGMTLQGIRRALPATLNRSLGDCERRRNIFTALDVAGSHLLDVHFKKQKVTANAQKHAGQSTKGSSEIKLWCQCRQSRHGPKPSSNLPPPRRQRRHPRSRSRARGAQGRDESVSRRTRCRWMLVGGLNKENLATRNSTIEK
jgi:hypothetical protein